MKITTMRRALVNSQSAVVLALAGLAAIPATATAQQVQTSFSFTSHGLGGGTGDGQITRTSVLRYSDLLTLDDAQREVVDVLFEGYTSSYQSARQRMTGDMEEIQQEFRDTQDFTLFRERMPDVMTAFRDTSTSLESQFFGDLGAVLSEAQVERMPHVDRMRRRETQLGFNVSGANVDLADVVHDMDVKVSGETNEALRAYELDLDRMLMENQRGSAEISLGGDIDFEEIQKSMAESHERGLKIRDINRRHARTLASLVPQDSRGQFERAVLERSFPRVYRMPHAKRLLDSARGFSDLSADQQGQLELIGENYQRDLEKANERWASAIEKADDDGDGGGSMFSGGGGRMMVYSMGGDDESPVGEASKARRELDRRTEDKIRETLSEDQIAKLPERRDENQEASFGSHGGAQQVIIRGG